MSNRRSSKNGDAVTGKRVFPFAPMCVLICCTFCAALVLTSCSERHAEDETQKLVQLELALVSAQSELQADKALLAEATRTGASPDYIAAIQKEVREDEIRLRTLRLGATTALIVGGTGNPDTTAGDYYLSSAIERYLLHRF